MKQTILGTANKGTVLREDVFDFSIESGKCHMVTLLVFGKFVSVQCQRNTQLATKKFLFYASALIILQIIYQHLHCCYGKELRLSQGLQILTVQLKGWRRFPN